MISFAAICPHPPLLVPAVGGDDTCRVRGTLDAMKELASAAEEEAVDTFLVISPHAAVFMDRMSINLNPQLTGDFSDFGHEEIRLAFENDLTLACRIVEQCAREGCPLEGVYEDLDHGIMVPLYFFSRAVSTAKACHFGFSYLDYEKHLAFGRLLGQAAAAHSGRVAIIASGDLSHRLTPDAPAGYSPQGRQFDEQLLGLLEKGKGAEKEILALDRALIDEAGECGLRSLIVLLGALSGSDWRFEKLGYEGPFGVGYLVGRFVF